MAQIAAFFPLAWLAAAGAATTCPATWHTYSSTACADHATKEVKAATASACCAACASDAQCGAYTFHTKVLSCALAPRADTNGHPAGAFPGHVCGSKHALPPAPAPPPPPPPRPRPPQPSAPRFSWRTVPVFAETSNVSGVFDEEAIGVLARFPLFVAEKAYNFPGKGFAEEKLTRLAARLRARNANMTLVFYYNANLDFTDYRLYNTSAAHASDWWLRDAKGTVFKAPIDAGAGARPPFPYNAHGGGVPVYDMTVQGMRDAWVQECLSMASRAGGYDGCMVDRWTRTPFAKTNIFTKAEMAAWVAGRDKATAALALQAHAKGVYLVGEGDQVDAVSDPGYGLKGESALLHQLALAAQGTGLLASYMPPFAQTSFMHQLAKFLVGAAQGHFFGAGAWTCNHTSREGATWRSEYDQPLGPPLGNATLEGSVYTRHFAFGTNVTYNSKTDTGTVQWGAFPRDPAHRVQ